MKKRPLKVFFLMSMNAGISYWRMWNFRQEMNRQGIAEAAMPWYHSDQTDVIEWQFHVNDDPRVYHAKGVLANGIKEADVVVVGYLHSMEALAFVEALKKALPKTVFLTEIDDYVLDTPTYNDAFTQYQPGWKYREIIVEQLKALDGVIVSTPFLADEYKQFNPHVYVVPNCLDFNVWGNLPKKRHKDVRIGWVGGASHTEDLKTIEKPMKEFLKEHDNVSFYCVHGAPEFFKKQSQIHTPLEWFPINKYPKKIAKYGFDIGIAPLVDNNFNRAKSNLRKLEYAGLGIPVVAANVGEFARTVNHGKDGFLYNDGEGFKKALHALVTNKKLRQAMGKYNQLDAKMNWNVEHHAKRYVEILREAHERGQTTEVDISERRNKWTEGQPALS